MTITIEITAQEIKELTKKEPYEQGSKQIDTDKIANYLHKALFNTAKSNL